MAANFGPDWICPPECDVPLQPISATGGLAASALMQVGHSGKSVNAVKQKAAGALKMSVGESAGSIARPLIA